MAEETFGKEVSMRKGATIGTKVIKKFIDKSSMDRVMRTRIDGSTPKAEEDTTLFSDNK